MGATSAVWRMISSRSSIAAARTCLAVRKSIVLGQINTMNESFIGLLSGLGFSIILVYLLIVVNFQSWLDPFIILMALPAALAGIVWMPVHHRNDDQCPCVDRRDHVHGRGDGQ